MRCWERVGFDLGEQVGKAGVADGRRLEVTRESNEKVILRIRVGVHLWSTSNGNKRGRRFRRFHLSPKGFFFSFPSLPHFSSTPLYSSQLVQK